MPVTIRRRALPKFAVIVLAVAGVMALAVPAASAAPSADRLGTIRRLAAEAYVWGLAAQFTYRFATYNTTISAPINALTYGKSPAAWNNSATNAGDSSIIYINGFMDFSKGDELVLTVPPSRDQYYVVNYLDNYINTIGSIGTRTTPSETSTSYLLVGPKSRYARQKVATIGGRRFPVMASDTNLNWMLIRIRASTLADSSNPSSTNAIYENVSKKFALNTLRQFKANGNRPVYPQSYDNPPPTDAELARAALFKDTPSLAVRFFEQLGTSLVKSPIPPATAGLGGTPVRLLPSWVVPQYGAGAVYLPPSFGQQATLSRFAPIGLTASGFRIPSTWGAAERAALQQGYEEGRAGLNAAISAAVPSSATNYWTLLNDLIGTYPNTPQGYLIRATIVLNGGSANIPLDAVYPSMNFYDGVNALDGNTTYKITFTPPQPNAPLPVVGIFPPQVTNAQGEPRGFWSVTLYQPDPSQVSAPFLTQAAVLNNAYSAADGTVVAVDGTANTITVGEPSWGKIIASTPLLFDGAAAGACGLTSKASNGVYYIANTPTQGTDSNGNPTYTFQISSTWKQDISSANVPIQYSGEAGAVTDLTCNSGSGLSYGVIRPVSQLGSSELDDGKLAVDPNGSVTIWVAPTLPAGAPATNWIPTPSTAYYNSVYGANAGLSTQLQLILRSYYPTPGSQPPSMLPDSSGMMTYIPPEVVPVTTP